MEEFEKQAVLAVEAQAREKQRFCDEYLAAVCSPLGISAAELLDSLLHRQVTLNFHPDRYDGNGEMILDGLLRTGRYLCQFETGTTNGGRTAYPGGDRFCWEQRLFSGSYPEKVRERPKYGALNVFSYRDGASARFGSCYFGLKPDVLPRCTFAYGDSSADPELLGTATAFSTIGYGLLRDAKEKGKLLNQKVGSAEEAVRILLSEKAGGIGRNLDDCIEVHIHGEVSLQRDVELLALDGSFQGTEIERKAEELCRRNSIKMEWIPERRMEVDRIDDTFRGPVMRPLAEQIDRIFGGDGMLQAERIGRASRDSREAPERWKEFGAEPELFQYFKQLWHIVAYFGRTEDR